MYDQLGSWVIFGAVALLCLYYAVRALIGRPTIHEAEPEPIQAQTETPADAEWRRRLTRWTAEQDAS